MIHLKIALPTRMMYEGDVRRVSLEAQNGPFTMLPRHIDFVAALTPGILYFDTADGEEVFFAVDVGIVVKCASDVLVSTHNAVRSRDLESLHSMVREHFELQSEQERRAHSALSRLEADFVRRYLEVEERG